MPWSWRLEKADGSAVDSLLSGETFTTQSDAETWLGENWRALADGGVDQVTLLEDDVETYEMSLHPDEG
jgi:hypothetical protein